MIFTIDLSRYLVAAGLMASLLAVLQSRLASRRLRTRPPRSGQVASELRASLKTVLVFSLFGLGIHWGRGEGVLLGYARISDLGWPYFLASIGLAVVAHDAYFYWTHRAMHHPALFRFFHLQHHRSIRPTPWTAYSFDTPEAIVQGAFLPLFLLVVPMHDAAIYVFLAHMIVRNVMAHCGYEIFPRRMADSKVWGWLSSVTHHELHHATSRWNYGFYFTWWDRLMKTEHPDYRKRLREAGKVAAAMPMLLLGLALPIHDAAAAERLEGEWATQGFSAKVRIEACGAGELCGRIVWLWKESDSSGQPIVDMNNPDPGLRSRALIGVTIVHGLRPTASNEWAGGRIYNPEDGRTYSASLRIAPSGELHLRGCALSVFCQTQIWRRTEAVCRQPL